MSDPTAIEDILQIATFFVGDEEFGVDVLTLREIIRPQEVTKVPRAEKFVEGVINLRGQVIPVINLRMRFGTLPYIEHGKDTRFMNMDVGGMVLGFVVDRIGKVYRFPRNRVEPAPAILGTVESEYIEGIIQQDDRMVLLLDPGRLLSEEILESLRQL